MPYIKKLLTEENFSKGIVDLAVKNGWTLLKTFKKLSYNFQGIFYGNAIPTEPDDVKLPFKIATHSLIKNSRGDIYGIARICDLEIKYKDIPTKFKSGSLPNQTLLCTNSELREELHTFLFGKEEIIKIDTSKVYFYMIHEEPKFLDIENFRIVYPSQAVKAADVLDIELQGYEPIKEKTNVYKFEPTINHTLMRQSPMVNASMRQTGQIDNGWLTNWWPDSTIKIEGFVNEEVLALMVRADSTPAFHDNQVPMLPVYFGHVVSLLPSDSGNAALFAGTAVNSPAYAYNTTTPHVPASQILMPLNKKYPQFPGNGIDNIIVKRGIQGAFYQGYNFKTFAQPEKAQPDRKDDQGRQFVSAWKNENNNEYTYPPTSLYNNKAAVTKAYITHAEERDRGYLKYLIFAPSIGPRNGAKLKNKKASCPDVFEYYKYFVSDAVSPITKRPSIVYRPIGIGIFEKEGV
ncbi:hypothetical protein ACQKMD_16760 [Viridibacillus sp. NPDC096237]|uniref:hypothetical protein n=1 Tax=Viridibacillus sp. NPDC096237 TaxID=3390721 RepID=UPI003CFC3C38